jgi:DNA-directed RNA polymerase subunit M/transcription elongation factor TFIIS
MGDGEILECPECRSNEVVVHNPRATALGATTRTVVFGYECVECGRHWAPDVELTGKALRPIRRYS